LYLYGGCIGIDIRGDGVIAQLFRDELRELYVESSRTDLLIQFQEHHMERPCLPEPVMQSFGDVRVGVSQVVYKTVDWQCIIRRNCAGKDGEPSFAVDAYPVFRRKRRYAKRFPYICQRMLTGSYTTVYEMQIKSFVYDVFHFLIQLVSLSKAGSIVHGATLVNPSGGAVLLTGWGGVGKTSSTIQLIRKYGYKGLSDDISFIDSTGHAHYNPLRAHIYPYNLENLPYLQKQLFETRSFLDRINWMLYGKNGVRAVRRVQLDMLYGHDNVLKGSAPLQHILYLVREIGRSGIEFTNISTTSLAARMASVLMWELKGYSELLAAVGASQNEISLPSIGEMERLTQYRLQSVFENSGLKSLKLLSVGDGVSPEHLAQVIAELTMTN
jgi:hypothetical protein